MSEYQYYEFLAIDRPLDATDRQALRALSTRAKISATQFVNTYEWGDFKGDPAKLMERWFDLHLYYANWGTRRLMLRLPKRFVDLPGLDCFLDEVEGVTVRTWGDNLIFDIVSDGEDYDGWDGDEANDASELAALAPMRAELIAGDLRLFYLLWLTAVQFDAVADDTPEPQPWSGPLTASLQAFADFFRINPDLVQAAVENRQADVAGPSAHAIAAAIAELPDNEKDAFLVRLFNAEPYAGTELRQQLQLRLRSDDPASDPPLRTVGALRARAKALRMEREHAWAEAEAARRRQEEAKSERQRLLRLDALAQKGDAVWHEIETAIERRNASGYTIAVRLLSDMKSLTSEGDTTAAFEKRLIAIHERHFQKARFIERLKAASL